MTDNVEYQIFIGCKDSQSRSDVVSEEELTETVVNFFARKQIDFTLVSAVGGYMHEDGSYVTEDSLCINIIGDPQLDIIKLTKSLSMFMNQESALVMRNAVKTEMR